LLRTGFALRLDILLDIVFAPEVRDRSRRGVAFGLAASLGGGEDDAAIN